ncbi:DUF2490 domain-containing protein [Muricauda sp. SCSIO 64092]|uniref:DUF2490 domain-containing protein n=1 Tax=Allomuricauda sp. SCSIO 64092 TaxID=2908842 RepID=UPI001FF294F8|nr:DUF2490 domain-containing protein [Muricauda sp. SCSIO 64092]UOY07095.1 DUF2490 domain-containing protein [Muricauda sp. SCSIO 64092]
MKKLLISIAVLLVHLQCLAQASGEEETGIWYMYFGMNRISEKLSIHSEAQFRYYETSGNFNQLLLRTGLNYHINQKAIATLGYAFIETDGTFLESPSRANLDEHRIFQQFILTNTLGEFLFEHRYRLEQRFISQTLITSDPEQDLSRTEHRARYRLQVMLPLTNTFFLNFYDELFINLQDNLFDQNRLYGAIGIHITENSNLQLGYLRNQFTNAVFDRLQIGFFFNPDLRGVFKNKKS